MCQHTDFKIYSNNFDTEFIGKTVYYYQIVNSTNSIAKDFAKKNVENGTIIISKVQNNGRGRNNHSWISPKGGLWMSIILKPNISPNKVQYLTLITGISLSKTINENFDLKTSIKWPNDVYIDDKKISGILTEGHITKEKVNYLILGIGVNLNNNSSDLQLDSQKIAVTLKEELGHSINICDFLNKFLKNLENYYKILINNDFNRILNDWKALNNTLGKIVEVKQGHEIIIGEAYDLGDDGSLIIKKEDGDFRTVIAGDCTIKKIKKYSN